VRVSKKILVVLSALLVAGVAIAADVRHQSVPSLGVPLKPGPRRAGPAAFGGSYNVSSVSALGFSPFDSSQTYGYDSLSFFKHFTVVPADFGGTVVIPAGAIIDYIGLGSCDEAGGNFVVAAFIQNADGTFTEIGSFTTSVHTAATPCLVDYNADFFDIQNVSNQGSSIQLQVHQVDGSPVDGSVSFGSVEVWWFTTVSAAPATPTFNDVPASDFGFQYIEALAASGITGGCGGGNYCPDTPVNRRQMAIFLAKALGLYWPF
jgi:S-layer homology domain